LFDLYYDYAGGQVDVTPIVKLITEGVNDPAESSSTSNNNTPSWQMKSPHNNKVKSKSSTKKKNKPSSTNLWSETTASTNNVQITRPSHDAWGIKKIILIFCDDLLHTIYTLPYYQKYNKIGKEMKKAMQPILDVLNIEEYQVVRCLLAGMPCGVTIPVHHDTGEWVKHTHRIHVPIIVSNPNEVLFQCGLTEDTLDRIDVTPGHVFEMNNQAKHTVTNGQSNGEYRVHLILDYVHPTYFQQRIQQNCPIQTINLSPGEVLTQTRRSIDRVCNAGSRNHPTYLIIGAQKAGTTSMYDYINQHPWVVRAKRRETHNLDWRYNTSLQNTNDRRKHCLSFYHVEGMKPYPSLITGDSTPSYLLDYYRVIPRLKECFVHEPQLIIMVREPIKRAISHYVMVTSLDGTPEQLAVRGNEWRLLTIEEVFEQDVLNMKEDGLLPYWNVETKTVDREIFDSFINTNEEDEAWEKYVTTRIPLNTGSYSPLARGLYALQCRQWLRSFATNKFLVLKLEDISKKGVQWAVNKSMEHLGLPRFEVLDATTKNSREYIDPLDGKNELRDWLQRFFEPHNERFGTMMIEELGYDEVDWKNVWSYA